MKISVLMSVYAAEDAVFFSEALMSLDNQILKASEVILVEDGPISHELSDQIDFYRQSLNINSVQLKESSGFAEALNAGLKCCNYELVARMDSDDIAMEDRFLKQMACFMNDSALDVLGSYAQEIDFKGRRGNIRKMPIEHQSIVDNLFTNPLIHPSVMFKKDSVLSIGGYDDALKRRQDYELWFRCAKAGLRFTNLPEVLLLYRFSAETHKKQSRSILLQQGLIGFRGVRKLHQPLWKCLAVFYPLFRSLFPASVEHFIYKKFKKYDPKHRE